MISSLLRYPGDVFADFDELHRQLDRILNSGRTATSSIRAVERGTFPAVNVGVTPEAVQIFAFAPGIDAGTLDVTIDKGLLSITGERKRPQPEGKVNVYARERSEGRFRRVVTLPEDADPERVSATYRDGVLRIEVQRREAARPRRIEVKDAR